MTRSIDARGLACPQPVVLAKKAIEEGEKTLEVLVDDADAAENVTRLGRKMDFVATINKDINGTRILLTKTGEGSKGEPKVFKSTVLFLDSDRIGRGSDELGALLIKNFLYALTETKEKPEKIVLMNSGVKLAVEGSPALESLEKLCLSGMELLICGTCLDFFQLKDKVAVGNISNMYDILESFLAADKVVTI